MKCLGLYFYMFLYSMIPLFEIKFQHVLPPKSLGIPHMGKVYAQIFYKEKVAQAVVLVNLFSTLLGIGVIAIEADFSFSI